MTCSKYYCAECDMTVHGIDKTGHKRVSATPITFTHPELHPRSFCCALHPDAPDDNLFFCTTCQGLPSKLQKGRGALAFTHAHSALLQGVRERVAARGPQGCRRDER